MVPKKEAQSDKERTKTNDEHTKNHLNSLG